MLKNTTESGDNGIAFESIQNENIRNTLLTGCTKQMFKCDARSSLCFLQLNVPEAETREQRDDKMVRRMSRVRKASLLKSVKLKKNIIKM